MAIIGGGRMGEALLRGLMAHGRRPEDLQVVEVSGARRDELARAFPGLELLAEMPASGLAADAVLAVKPPDVVAAAAGSGSAGAGRLLSIAAGVGTSAIESAAGAGVRVLRAMPNTPAQIGAGASALCAGRSAEAGDIDWAEAVLRAVGMVVRVEEGLIDAVTGLSGSGPAYVFLLAEAMMEAGRSVGLADGISRDLTVQTLLGAARLLSETGTPPEELRAMVTSPKGTTAAGVAALEDRGFRQAVVAAVIAATERSRQLG